MSLNRFLPALEARHPLVVAKYVADGRVLLQPWFS